MRQSFLHSPLPTRALGTRLTGAVFGSAPHIVKVDEYDDLFAFKPEGNYILTFRNEASLEPTFLEPISSH